MAELTQETMPADSELFSGSLATEQTQEPAQQETTTEQPSGDRPRDEQGRFAPKTEAKVEPAQQQPPGQTEPQTDTKADAMVPSWRLAEEANERRRIQAEHETSRRELEDFRRRFAALEAEHRKATTKPEEVPDLLADPPGFTNHLQQTFDSKIKNLEANFSFRIAHVQHGDTFAKAYQDMIGKAERGDRSVVQHVMGSSDPGQALVTWYKRDQTIAQVGDDPNAWLEKQLEERMKDPAFQAKVIEHARTQAGQQQQNGGRPNVVLPPSLSRAPSAGGHNDSSGDMSDASLFRQALR